MRFPAELKTPFKSCSGFLLLQRQERFGTAIYAGCCVLDINFFPDSRGTILDGPRDSFYFRDRWG